jgi:imidazolonepropionase-like amidohydrolase
VFPNLEPEEFLRRVTTNPARALGMGGQVGELVPNAFADMVLLPYEGGTESAVDAAVSHAGPARAVMLDGHWEVPPPSFVNLE